MKLSQRLGFVVTAIYLIVAGVDAIIANLTIPAILIAVLAIAAGAILLLSLSGKRDRHLGVLLLGIWLVARGIIPLINLSFTYLSLIMGLLALLAGILLLVNQTRKTRRGWGYLLLAIWLIATGAVAVLGLSFQYQGVILGILAIAAGLLILIRR